MSSKSSKPINFMRTVHAMQKGKIPKSGKAGNAAESLNEQDVKDFLMQKCGLMECNVTAKKRILTVLKDLIGHGKIMEDADTPNVVASSKTLHGDFDQTLKMYRGFEFTPKENQAIQNFDEAEPSVHDKFRVQYSKSDDFTNNSTIVVKKLKEPSSGRFVYTALVKIRGGAEEQPPDEPEPQEQPKQAGAPQGQPPQPPQQPQQSLKEEAGDEIKIIKSVPIDDQAGDEILTNFLQAVYHQQA